jgi:cobalt-precorrin-5B (C1)-methyltransferase
VSPGQCLQLEVVFPRGRELAERTSNAAFGVVDGLALIGTQAEVQRSAAPDQLRARPCQALGAPQELPISVAIGAGDWGKWAWIWPISWACRSAPLLKAGNWIGPLLVAAEAGVSNLLLLGYHGKVDQAGGRDFSHPPPSGRWSFGGSCGDCPAAGTRSLDQIELLGCASRGSALQFGAKRDCARRIGPGSDGTAVECEARPIWRYGA